MQIGPHMDCDEPGFLDKHPFPVVLAQIPAAGVGQTLFFSLNQTEKG